MRRPTGFSLKRSGYPKVDLPRILAKINEHLPVQLDMSEMTLRDLSLRTKRYFLQTVARSLIDSYISIFDALSDHMFKYFGVCLVLEETAQLQDTVLGVYQIYEKAD